MAQRYDFMTSRVDSRQHDRGLDGFRPTAGEEGFPQVARRQFAQAPRGLRLFFGHVQGGRVPQRGDLLLNARDNGGMAVAQRGRQHTGKQIQILAAVRIGNPNALRRLYYDWLLV